MNDRTNHELLYTQVLIIMFYDMYLVRTIYNNAPLDMHLYLLWFYERLLCFRPAL